MARQIGEVTLELSFSRLFYIFSICFPSYVYMYRNKTFDGDHKTDQSLRHRFAFRFIADKSSQQKSRP